ncbi:MAG: DEAD/DEAH box helicase [Anaerolineae bacterium]|nr:DEAD/DEAH box helicase [Anaerolineae bacterium]
MPPGTRGSPMADISAFMRHLRALPDYAGQIVHEELLAPHAAEYAELERPLPASLAESLAQQGVARLYTHQAEAINAVRAGQNIIVATGTASGKTLCYNVPLLEAALHDPLTRGLYLFPTKALAQDQLRALNDLGAAPALEHLTVGTYDGDTPQGARPRLRRTATVVLTNPDMLHVGILPNHDHWAGFFRYLKYVVLDEAHIYRGVFGSHVAALLRRLRRVCHLYGSEPQFILCSATIANAQEHASRLTGCPVQVVEHDGAPHGPRHFVLWNPPFLDQAAGVRQSVNTQASLILSEMVKHALRNITFVRARKVAELLLLYTRNALEREQPDLAARIAAYRSGYLAQDRRTIEQRLFAGELLGVTATNALELGIDVGHLDATLLVGYPGTIASTWQQAGRAGRGRGEAFNVLIGQDNPLDQYFMRHPQELFGRPHEHALIDPANPYILADHLTCAAYESPLGPEDRALFGPECDAVLVQLEDEGVLQQRDGRWYHCVDDYPAQHVNLRSASASDFWLVDESAEGQVLEHIDSATAFLRVYPGAIYLHQAQSYLVTDLDLGARVAYARPVEASYYTEPREVNDVRIVRSLESRVLGATVVYFGRVRVTQQVIGFRRRQQFTEALLSDHVVDLPETQFETQALWFEITPRIQSRVTGHGLDLAGGLHAIEHACIGMLPLLTMCDRNDIGGLSTPEHPDTGCAQVFVYDGYPGGMGLVHKGFELIEELWRRTLQCVRECPCEVGCPSCIYSYKCGNNNEPLDKEAAVVILSALLGE